MPEVIRGDIWEVDLGSPLGSEAGFTRPAVVITAGESHGYGLVCVLPITKTDKPYPTRVTLQPGDLTGLHVRSFIQCEQPRTLSSARLTRRLGLATGMSDVNRILRLVLDL